MTKAVLGIIGGSGLYDLPGLEHVREERIESPWGEPSSPLRIGEIAGLPIVFMSRHDKGHRIVALRHQLPRQYRRDEAGRGHRPHLAVGLRLASRRSCHPAPSSSSISSSTAPSIARARFFGKGCVAHVSMAHPVAPRLRLHLTNAAEAEDIPMARERHIYLHGGAAIFDACRERHVQ